MQRASFADMECPIARAAEEVGEGWSILILRNAFMGARTFQDFEERLGIATSTLTRRLGALCDQGLLARRRYQENPPRDEYVLTEKGLDFLPVLLSLAAWGNRWLAPGGAPIVPVDMQTGNPVDPIVIDRRTSRPLRPGHVGLTAGPGASKALRRDLAQPVMLGRRTTNEEKVR
jgi:DNA-binding HxlR family transcriptional regulator